MGFLLNLIPFLGKLPKLSPKQWGILFGSLALVSVLAVSHIGAYKWGVHKTEAAAAEQNLALERQVRTLEEQLRATADEHTRAFVSYQSQSDTQINQLQQDLEYALSKQTECRRTVDPAHPDPTIRLWSEAIDDQSLPPSPDQPITVK